MEIVNGNSPVIPSDSCVQVAKLRRVNKRKSQRGVYSGSSQSGLWSTVRLPGRCRGPDDTHECPVTSCPVTSWSGQPAEGHQRFTPRR